MGRRHYLDNLRLATVALVVVYHVCYLFNGADVPGGIPDAESLPAGDALCCFVYPWFMVLLFVVAGISARYSLERRGSRQFLRERAAKLLVPSTLGLFVVHWVTGYLNIKLGGGLAYLPAPLVYPVSAVSGIGPLWFIQTLFLFSCVLVLLKGVWDRLRDCALPSAALPGLFLLLWAGAQAGNVPVLTMYRFGVYFTAFLIGYCVLSHESQQAVIERFRIPLLVATIAGGVVFTAVYYGQDYTAPTVLQHIGTSLYLWVAVLALLGCFRHSLNREMPRYLRQAGFGVYVLHYPVLMVVCYTLHTYGSLPAAGNYAAALALGLPGTLLLYEGVRRVPVVRFLVLGVRGKPSASPENTSFIF